MKRKLKTVVAMLLLIAVCFSLSSCAALDKMRKEQAFYTENGDIIWNGKTYKALPDMEQLFIESFSFAGYVTNPDVPVLLSGTGNSFSVTEPHGLLNVSTVSYGTKWYYCPEEKYDYYKELAENYVLNKYCYETYEMSTQSWDYTHELVIVSDELEAAIGDILTNHRQDDMKYRYNYLYQLYLCDETKTFYGSSFEVIEVENIGYYIMVEGKSFNTQYYKIPNQYKDLFELVYIDIQNTKNNSWETIQ